MGNSPGLIHDFDAAGGSPMTSIRKREMTNGTLHRLSAFTDDPAGGNPAGVWVGDELPDAATMQKIAADVGASETAFVAPATGIDREVRYFSPELEVSFCGHATIATGAVLGTLDGEGTYRLATSIGEVLVTARIRNGNAEASLVSVDTRQKPLTDVLLDEALAALGWDSDDLDDSIPPTVAYAGAWHLVLAVAQARRLADLDYDFEKLKALMLRDNLTTLQLVWREEEYLFHSRNPFPIGGIVEDPATGAAAAALGGYLRDAGIMAAPATFLIRQGEAMGRPSLITVDIPVSGGITVTGSAVET
jgi:PhzF family phenazine biosynthesis protein